ncbi:unnamed protein product [Agarophyton chilense]|eukprot:gb/GEZJ01002576.1/.p1 GENE.gb/GEZJ01002576.1/~~gb/GEZJ01002576.1/.p1  ORF type:complete len:466 (-),score=64.22 gb/GEZJ01002576.1/:481-1878(-)
MSFSNKRQRKHWPTGQCHENESARIVIVCAPTVLSKMMGSLHPAGALYEKPVNTRLAVEAHEEFVKVIESRGITVYDVRDILLKNVEWSVGDRVRLEQLAFKCLTYVYKNVKDSDQDEERCVNAVNGNHDFSGAAGEYYVSDKYKKSVVEEMGKQQLVDIILTNPTVVISPSQRDTGFTATYQFEPLSNIVFVRDQQITTRKGIVMAKLRSKQREREVDIMEFCFKKLGLNVIGRIPYPAHLEGGDFFPVGEKLALIGVGPRSDWGAVEYLLENDLIGSERVAVVKDQFEKLQERMHLDTVFNILSNDCCIMLNEMMGPDSSTRRMVDVYVKHGRSMEKKSQKSKAVGKHSLGNYVLEMENVEFSQYMIDQGFTIIPITGDEQLNYGCNMLNLGNGDIISIEKKTARRIACSKAFEGTVEFIDFKAVTCMYGGVHCASQVVSRDHVLRSRAEDSEPKSLLKMQDN